MKITKQVYVADCIEHGDRFFSHFQTNETNKSKLMEMGVDLAAEWGGECISVKAFKPKVVKLAKMWDIKEKGFLELTERRYKNWVKKHPTSSRYDYSKTEFYTETEPMPVDVWDCDATGEENMAAAKKV